MAASGFVGRVVCRLLDGRGRPVTAAVRRVGSAPGLSGGVRGHLVGEIGPYTDWSGALEGVKALLQLAARVPGRSPLAERLLRDLTVDDAPLRESLS